MHHFLQKRGSPMAQNQNPIRIHTSFPEDVTVISNAFLDRFLPEVNGDFLKVYLLMMRTLSGGRTSLSLTSMADTLNCTEQDVIRALRYWEKAGVLSTDSDEDGTLREISFTDYLKNEKKEIPSDAKPSDISPERMKELGSREEIRELLFIAQQYIGKPLTRAEMQKIFYYYDVLGFSADLIDYLIEYCVGRGHKSFAYITKVALNWHESGITTVRDARLSTESYHREYYDILKALGIDNHHPVDAEIQIMKKWIENYSFSMDIIREACTRTVMNASKPTLSYADSILSRWHSADVKTLDDLKSLDAEHAKKSSDRKNTRGSTQSRRRAASTFNNFEQRDLSGNDLETQLLKKTREAYADTAWTDGT